MSDVTVKQFSEVVGVPVDRLLSQLSDAGLEMKSPDDTITDDEKMMLLEHLRTSHGKAEKLTTSTPKQVTLRRKTRTELKVGGSAQGRTGKTVNVEVRKKRTYVKRSVLDEERQRQEAEEQARLEAERAAAEEKARAEEEARREEEERQAAEEAEAKAREEAEEKARQEAEEAERLKQQAIEQAAAQPVTRADVVARKARHGRHALQPVKRLTVLRSRPRRLYVK